MAGSLTDIPSVAPRSNLATYAFHDALTGLPKIAPLSGALGFVDGSRQAAGRLIAYSSGLDRFKFVNDSRGPRLEMSCCRMLKG